MDEVAQQLEQNIIGEDRVAFPCGCISEVLLTYPGRDWIRTAITINRCGEHPNGTLDVNDFHYRWVHRDGSRVTYDELSVAMDEHIWKCKKPIAVFNVVHAGPGGVTISYMFHPHLFVCAERLPGKGVAGAVRRNGGSTVLNHNLERACTAGTLLSSDEINSGALFTHIQLFNASTWEYIHPPYDTLPVNTSVQDYPLVVLELENKGFRSATNGMYMPAVVKKREEVDG